MPSSKKESGMIIVSLGGGCGKLLPFAEKKSLEDEVGVLSADFGLTLDCLGGKAYIFNQTDIVQGRASEKI